MLPNNNLSVLPWYTSEEQRNARKWWLYGKVYPLYCYGGQVLPFQLMRTHRAETIQSVFLYREDETLVQEVTGEMIVNGLVIVPFTSLGYDVIVYPGLLQVLPSLDNGRYFLTMSDGVEEWYSEIFTVVNNIQPYLKIEWWDMENFVMDAGTIVYTSPNFRNVLYLQADLAKPEYLFTEEGEERDGYFFAEKQISEKRYHFKFWASEYLLDVLRLAPMADYIRVTYRGRIYNLDSLILSPEWEAAGDVAAVSAQFDTATVAKKLGRGYVRTSKGDFNNDFSNDFDNI